MIKELKNIKWIIKEIEMNKKDLDELRNKPFAKVFPEVLKKIEKRLCPSCGKKIGKFRNKISRKEYKLSGICQSCQDGMFGTSIKCPLCGKNPRECIHGWR